MELDFSSEWRIIGPDKGVAPADAARELASTLVRMGCRAPTLGEGNDAAPLMVLHEGAGCPGETGGRRRLPCFSWRASPSYVEIFGEDSGALLRGVYDFLGALGARWVEPGARGERLPRGPVLHLAESSRRSDADALAATLILGHGVFLERWADYLPWAARAGYSSVFVHTTPDSPAIGAAPRSLYEALRPSISAAARDLGLRLELGGHCLSALLPRKLFKEEPALFRERDGQRSSDLNFCTSNPRAIAIVSETFAAIAIAHPEIAVFHAWPDDLPGGGWCSCPSCASLSPAAQSLAAARALASALARARPDASVSFLAYHDTEDIGAVLAAEASEQLPANLELLWAPRLRCWGAPLGAQNSLNAASLASFRRTARAWRAAGGGRVAVFEYWEDAVLFKSAVPPLSSVIEGDLEAYKGGAPDEKADAVGILCTGGRLPLAPRPNLYLMPRLAAKRAAAESRAPVIMEDWATAAYGPASVLMLEYWRALESAWAIDLDLEAGDSAILMPAVARYASEPPADWGDPWKASVERLAVKRERCEELFDHLRLAEAKLSEAKLSEAANAGSVGENASSEGDLSEEKRAVEREASEYAISGSVLELDCARLSVYHELAAGDRRAAADIANLALSASSALRKAFARLPDLRARREMGLLIGIFYDLRLRAIRRANARSGLRRLLDLWYTSARTALAAASVRRSYEAKGIATPPPKY